MISGIMRASYLLLLAALLALLPLLRGITGDAVAKVERQAITLSDSTEVKYRVVLPDGYDPAQTYPAILAFSGDAQTAASADWMIKTLLRRTAEKRGYIVVVPVANDAEHVFFRRGMRVFPEFLDRLNATYPIRDKAFHMLGVSNGGITAFIIAALNPRYFPSILVMPGYVGGGSDEEYAALAGKCIVMLVGQKDKGWVDLAKRDKGKFEQFGFSPHLEIVPNGRHIPRAYMKKKAYKLFDLIESGAGCPPALTE